MKKTKLIVPAALAVMLLSTAASVTGTVAWFTANRAVSASTTSFAVKAVDGNLSITAAPNFGTTVSSPTSDPVISMVTTNSATLTDGSVDHVNSIVYRKQYKTTDATNFINSASEGYKRTVGSVDYWFAISWKFDFAYEFAGDTGETLNLYFDQASTATPTKENDDGTTETYKGFRIAFVADTPATATSTDKYLAGNTKVWAPLQEEDYCYYINSTSAPIAVNNGATYSSGLIASDTAVGVANTADNGSSSAVNCLGQFVADGTKKIHISFTCYAWYEGTDENVVNNATATFGSVVTSMNFFIRPNA